MGLMLQTLAVAMRSLCRASALYQTSKRCELNQAPIQFTFTANTTCPMAAGLSDPVSVH